MSESIPELITGLLLFIQSQLGLFNPIEPPNVEFLAMADITEIACQQPCGEVKGWTPPGDTVYLSNELRLNQDMFDRSIVLHELVHFAQYKHKLINEPSPCLTWKAREAQAYQLQLMWLQKHKVKYNSLSLKLTLQNFHRIQCRA